jgi:hypothetical protein
MEALLGLYYNIMYSLITIMAVSILITTVIIVKYVLASVGKKKVYNRLLYFSTNEASNGVDADADTSNTTGVGGIRNRWGCTILIT